MVRRTVMPRRARLFDDRDRPTWIVAENPWHKIMEVRALPAGTDLMRTFILELLRYQDAGWRLNEFSAFSASFYATKEYEQKRHIYIALEDPTTSPPPRGLYGPAAEGGISR